MRSTLVVTTPASSLQLLTIEEMRAAAGVAEGDSSKDVLLQARGLAIAAAIMSECNIAVGNGADPTLLQETLTETFYHVHTRELLLSRRHNIEIVSITGDGIPLDAAEWQVESESGFLHRLWAEDGRPRGWSASKLVVEYKAGFVTPPGDLKMAAMDFYGAVSQGAGRDPLVKSETHEIPGMETVTKDYWVGSVPGGATEDAVPDVVSGQLKRYRNSEWG